MNDLQKLRDELTQLDNDLAQPNAYNDPKIGQKTRRQAELQSLIELFEQQQQLQENIKSNHQMVEGGGELATLAKEELPSLEQELESTKAQIYEALTPKDPNNDKNVIIEVRAGAGGDEASLFAGELFRMYSRLAEQLNFKLEFINKYKK